MDKSTKSNRIELSIILPAYNEQDSLKLVVKSVLDVVIPLIPNFEIIIIDDGSTDRTAEIAAELSQSPHIRFFQHPQNLGMGKAIKTGINNARFPLIMDIPCDYQFDSRDIPKFMDKIKMEDIVVGYRFKKNESFQRRFYSNFNLILLNLLFGLKLKDPTWVKMFRRGICEKINLESDGFFWETEILIKAKNHGFKIGEVPTNAQTRYSGISKGSNMLRALDVFFSMLMFWFRTNFLKAGR